MTAAIDRVFDALRDANIEPKRSGENWSARCPAHDDKSPSLSLAIGHDERALLHCHAGCDVESIANALGLTVRDLMPADRQSPTKGRTTDRALGSAEEAFAVLESRLGTRSATWTYNDAEGTPVGYVLRWDSPSGKTIRPVSRASGGGWSIGGMPEPRPLYRLPDLSGAPRVYVCEGEKAAEAARVLGLVATTSAHGSNSARMTDWTPLAGVDVVILPDHDQPGEKYADEVATATRSIARSVRIVRLPGRPESGDIADIVHARRGEEVTLRRELDALVNATEPLGTSEPERIGPEIVNLANVVPQPVRWLWPDRFAVGKVSMIIGDPGLGKSILTLDVVARVTTGTPWPDGRGSAGPPAGAVLVNVEDDLADTIRPRLDAAGADVRRVNAFHTIVDESEQGEPRRRSFTLGDVPELEEVISATPDCRLVVIDPLGAFLGGTDSHKNAEVRALLAPLSVLASRLGVAIVVVSHLNKGSGPAIYRATGSLAFTAAARAVWLVCEDEHDSTRQRRLFLPVKNNLGDDESGLAFSVVKDDGVDAPCVVWEDGPVRVSANDALTVAGPEKEGRHERRDAAEFLRSALADGPLPAKEVFAQARLAAVTRATLRRAKSDLGVKVQKSGFDGPWTWSLGGEPSQTPEG